jgi:hypothetical protein
MNLRPCSKDRSGYQVSTWGERVMEDEAYRLRPRTVILIGIEVNRVSG